MRQLWRVMSFFMSLHQRGYTGRTEVSWKDGVPQHTRTESNRVPDELPSADEELVDMLESAKREA